MQSVHVTLPATQSSSANHPSPVEDYYAGLNEYLAGLVPQSAMRILDVGCATGVLGSWLKAQAPEREVWGIEVVPKVAQQAEKKLDRVLVGNIEDLMPLPIELGFFDCITFGDVLEHLVEPGEVLRQLLPYLAEEGTVALCVPNVAHWSNLVELLKGDFPYADNGLLDRTHLRFFTPTSMARMLEECGLEVMAQVPIQVPNPGVTALFGQTAAGLGLDAETAQQATTIYQQTFLARKKVLTATREESMSSVFPASELESAQNAQPTHSIVIVTYNSLKEIPECLKSVLMTMGPNDEILVIDNASTDGTRDFLAKLQGQNPQLQVTLNENNVGFSAGCNQGIKNARGEFVTLLNPDTLVTPGWLPRMHAFFQHPQIAAVGPTSDWVAGIQQVQLHVPANTSGEFNFNSIAELLGDVNAGQGLETKLLIGFCMMLRKSALDEVGMLDETLFLGNDDLDLSWRLRNKGYQLCVAKDVFVHHAGHKSFASEAQSKTDKLVQESTDHLANKLESHYGKGNVPTSTELWGIDWFKPSWDLWETPQIPAPIGNPHALYLDAMIRSLTNWIYAPSEPNGFDAAKREDGSDWPPFAHTMTGLKRLRCLQQILEDVIENKIEGDFVETGVWRGGSSIFARACFAAYNESRKVWVCDSFEGLPAPDPEKYPADKGDDLHKIPFLAVSQEQVTANFARHGLLDDQVKFLKGWFKDTLPDAPIETVAVARLDGDMYESTMDALNALYPKISVGGYVIIDDFGALESCKQAVHDFRTEHGITDEIHRVDWTGAYWKKSA